MASPVWDYAKPSYSRLESSLQGIPAIWKKDGARFYLHMVVNLQPMLEQSLHYTIEHSRPWTDLMLMITALSILDLSMHALPLNSTIGYSFRATLSPSYCKRLAVPSPLDQAEVQKLPSMYPWLVWLFRSLRFACSFLCHWNSLGATTTPQTHDWPGKICHEAFASSWPFYL